jgi:hypothetical protein
MAKKGLTLDGGDDPAVLREVSGPWAGFERGLNQRQKLPSSCCRMATANLFQEWQLEPPRRTK